MDVKYIKDHNNNNISPVTLEKGVIDDNGVTLTSKLGNCIQTPSGGTVGQVLTKTADGVEWGNASGGIANETDPVFTASPAYGITANHIATWNAKQDALTFDSTPTASSSNPVTSGGVKAGIDVETSRATAAEAELRAAYAALNQANVVPVAEADWPLANLQQNTIYRVAGSASYTDYMYNGTATIVMATYSNTAVVMTAAQSLTDAQKAQARTNIGVADAASDVSYVNNYDIDAANVQDALDNAADTIYTSVEHFDISKSVVSTSDATYISIDKTDTGFEITCLQLGAGKYAYCTIPGLTIGETYHVTFDYVLTGESQATYPYNITIRDAAAAVSTALVAVKLQQLGMSGSVTITLTPTTLNTAFRVANNDISLEGGTMAISNISVTTVKGIDENVRENTESIELLQKQVAEVSPNLLTIEDCEIGTTDASRITVEKSEGNLVFNGVNKAKGYYAWVKLPLGLVPGKSYKLELEYTTTDTGNCPCPMTSMRDFGTSYDVTTAGYNYTTYGLLLKSGDTSSWCYFTYRTELECIRINADSMDTGSVITVTKMRLAKTNNIFSQYDERMKVLEDEGDFSSASVIGNYSGLRIPPITNHKFGYTKLMVSGGNSSSRQGCAAYNGYLFEFGNNNAYVNVYNLATGTFHSTVTPTNIRTSHCNTVCFSEMFFADGDTFPLLYVSGGSTSDYHYCQVYRITLASDVFTITQVQDLILPVPTAENDLYSSNVLIDCKQGFGTQKGFLWVSGNRGARGMYWAKFAIPDVVDSGGNAIAEATLTDVDMIEKFYTETTTDRQSGIVIDGICYMVSGVPIWGDTVYFIAVDLWGKRLINNKVNMSAMGWTWEPEGLGLYDGHLYCNTQGNGIYKLYF